MKVQSHVVEVNKTNRTARIVASFENSSFAEIAKRAMNDAINESWYGGDKSVVYGWVPANKITSWSISCGYQIIE